MATPGLLTRLLRPGSYYKQLADNLPAEPTKRDDVVPRATAFPHTTRWKLDRPIELKSFSPAQIESAGVLGRPMWTDWDTEAAIEDGYDASTWVFVAIDKIARAAASLPLIVEKRDPSEADQWAPATEHPVQALLDKPNDKWDQAHFVKVLIPHLYLGGNAIVTKIRAMNQVVEMWLHNPKHVKPIPDREEFIKSYEFSVSGRKNEDAANIIHLMFPDPDNPYWGMSPLMAGGKAVDTDVKAAAWQMNTLDNGAVPSGMVKMPIQLAADAHKKTRERITEDLAGVGNARKVAIGYGDAEFVPFSLTPQELDWIQSRKFTREEILALFQVPPPVVGIYENATLANIETARTIFWVDTMLPLMDSICQGLTLGLREVLGDDHRVNYDASNVEALWPIFEKRLEAARKLLELGYHMNDISKRLNLGMNDITAGHISWVPAGLVPAAIFLEDAMSSDGGVSG